VCLGVLKVLLAAFHVKLTSLSATLNCIQYCILSNDPHCC